MLPPGSGLGIYRQNTPKVIRLLRQGCTNRPFIILLWLWWVSIY